MKKIFYKMVCLICIMIMIIVLMIHGFRSFSKTQVKSFDLVTNKEIPISKISGFYVDSDENFYVGIDDFSWIEIFDKNGKFVCSIAMKGLVYNFYVDKDGLLHIFCTYRTSDNIYEQIIDIEKNSIISEEVIKDEPVVNMNPKKEIFINNKLYSIDKNVVKIKSKNYEKEIKLDIEIKYSEDLLLN